MASASTAFVAVAPSSGSTLAGYTGDASPASTECVRANTRHRRCSVRLWRALPPLIMADAASLRCRRTSYSLIGRATLGVKVTHQKLRLGGEPRGALNCAPLFSAVLQLSPVLR